MDIYQSLAEASLYRAVALIPEQAAFGLGLSNSPARDDPETQRSLALGQHFCDLFIKLTKGIPTPADSELDATILSGLGELPAEERNQWLDRILIAKGVIDTLLARQNVQREDVIRAGELLLDFAADAKQKIAVSGDADHLRRSWC